MYECVRPAVHFSTAPCYEYAFTLKIQHILVMHDFWTVYQKQNMQSKSTTTTLLIVLLVIFTFPIWIGIAGGILGIIAGIFGAGIGIIVGIFGAIFGAIGGIFGWLFNWHWPFGGFFQWNIVTILILAIVVLLISRSRRI